MDPVRTRTSLRLIRERQEPLQEITDAIAPEHLEPDRLEEAHPLHLIAPSVRT